jgi:fructose-1,6-bisphosphatase/inositol monophosphatase family enzyme
LPSPHAALIADLFRRYDELALGAYRRVRAEVKADGTTVTAVDREASRMVGEALRAHTPDWGLLSEEEAQPYRPEAQRQWVVDPLDGTASFARGYPVWGLGIGLLEGEQPREGYLRFPALDETYAWDGARFTFNGAPAPSEAEPLGDTRNCLLDSSLHRRLQSFAPLRDYKLRVFGSALYHLVSLAMGRAEAVLCGRVYLWDIAAALPMTRARGFVERYADGRPFELGAVLRAPNRRVLAPLLLGSAERVDALVAALQPVLPPPD